MMQPLQTVTDFDEYLEARGLQFEATVIGGTALVLLGAIHRNTRDVDVLTPILPMEIREAAVQFAQAQRAAGYALADDWLNNGPAQLCDTLPHAWRERTLPIYSGKALRLMTLGRLDLLRTKCFALCDRGTDWADCIALAPTAKELESCLPWLIEQDGNELWPEHVRRTLEGLGKNLGHAV